MMKPLHHNAIGFAGVAALFLGILQMPEIVANNSHDFGSQAAYEYWTLHKYRYGREIVQNVGPLGFINYPGIYTGFLDGPKLLLTAALTLILAVLAWTGSKSVPPWVRIAFLLLVWLFAVQDIAFYILLLLVSHRLMTVNRLATSLPLIALLALIALSKGTLLFISLTIVLAYALYQTSIGKVWAGLASLLGFVVCQLVLWLLVGQHLEDYLSFIHGMASFSSGYNGAMAVFESAKMRNAGFIALVGSLVPIVFRGFSIVRSKPYDPKPVSRELLLLGVETLILMIVWKHGFVRADGHVGIFFQYVIVSNLWTTFRDGFGSVIGRARGWKWWGARILPGLVAIACLVGIKSVYRLPLTEIFANKYHKMGRNIEQLAEIGSLFEKLDTELSHSIGQMTLPMTAELTRGWATGYFGMTPGIMVYNNLNYSASPSTISFAAWNRWIMEADQSFFKEDGTAPKYLVYDLTTIDNRLGAQDDSLAQLEILHRYSLVGGEGTNLILERNYGVPPYRREQILTQGLIVGEWVSLPAIDNGAIWISLSLDESVLENLVSLIYKSPAYEIEVLFLDGARQTYKFIPSMARVGFLISPLADSTDAIRALASSEGCSEENQSATSCKQRMVAAFKLTCTKLSALCGRSGVVKMDRISGLSWLRSF